MVCLEYNWTMLQFEYTDWLAVQSGCEGVEEWRIQMYLFAAEGKLSRVETYRDEWDDHHLILQAQQDFRKYTSLKICSNI